jgi:hypothetical protein
MGAFEGVLVGLDDGTDGAVGVLVGALLGTD